MEHHPASTTEPLTSSSRPASACALFGMTALLLAVTGCSYGAMATQPRPSDAVARLQDSLNTQGSVDFGYYRQPRGTITGAVSSISLGGGVRRPYVRTLADLLQGRIAGFSVLPTRGGGISMRVRGGGGIGAAPLVIVDGYPMPAGPELEGFLGGIDPDDVVRVDVLKDISATAIYGTRGSGGVVLITLRHAAR